MSNILASIDDGPIGSVTLSNGAILEIPKLTTGKLIKIAKFIGIDGMKIYEQFQDTIADDSLSDFEKITAILTDLKEEQIIHILSILLEVSDEDALKLDPVETLEIIEVYVEKTNIAKAFTIVRNLTQKLTGKVIPDKFGQIVATSATQASSMI